jgi:uncharacterized surface protein with fasciclin (FAS1) repeats
MKKSLIALATATTLTLTGTASAECAMQKAGSFDAQNHAAVYTGGEGAFVKTGGYGMNEAKKAASTPDIVDTAVSAGSFDTLVTAVQAAGLVDTLKSDGPFTVFAPTDEAFAKLPAGTLESLLADREKLAAVLKYHVVLGKLDAQAVTSKTTLETAEGSALPVGDIKIVDTDIMTSNGIIHVIDEVLIPAS